jgi:hypothetical protein
MMRFSPGTPMCSAPHHTTPQHLAATSINHPGGQPRLDSHQRGSVMESLRPRFAHCKSSAGSRRPSKQKPHLNSILEMYR